MATGQRFDEIPANLRHKYRLTLHNDWGEDVFSRTVDLPAIAGGTIALSFKPATDSDERIIKSYIPDEVTDLSQLPQSLPGYLIRLEAEFVIDNNDEATGAVFQMGSEITMNQALYSPQFGWESTDSTIVAGEYYAIGVNGAGVAAAQLEQLQSEMQSIQALLDDCRDNDNCLPLKSLNKHRFTGNILQSGILIWFSLTQAMDRINARQQNVIYQPLPSYGKFSTSAEVQYSWGIPRNISFYGVMMDIDHNRLLVEAENGDSQNRINFARLSGTQGSGYEHSVPEKMFSTTDNPVEGISAIKALSIAMQEGQSIYTLTQNNMAQLSNISIESDVRAEIQSALLSGKEVTVHARQILANGWDGSGYIIFDPITGSGAYKISGGANGGWVDVLSGFAFGLGIGGILGIGVAAALMGGPLGFIAAAIVLSVILMLLIALPLYIYQAETLGYDPISNNCWQSGFEVGGLTAFTILAFGNSFLEGILASIIEAIFGVGGGDIPSSLNCLSN